MARANIALMAFNRGRISPLALARLDLDRMALSADIQTNWMPRLLGSMMLRPGLEYLHSTHNNAKAYNLKFVFALSDQAVIELTDGVMRVKIDDEVLARPLITTALANGLFESNLNGWSNEDEAGALSEWVDGDIMGLTGTGANAAIRTQKVGVSGANIGVEHGVRIKVNRGVVNFKIGSSAGGGEYAPETTLREGEFSFSVIPDGDFYISVSSTREYRSLVDSISIEPPGPMAVTSPWVEEDLPFIRSEQSGDVLYVVCRGVKQYKIERRATRSWGISEYLSEDGPFRAINITPTTIASSAISGDVTLTASKAIFRESSVGAIYRITSTGQTVESSIASENIFTDSIRVTGVGASRVFTINRSGTWDATVVLQRSIGDEDSWADTGTVYTENGSITFDDGLDNQIIFYRLGISAGDYVSGTAVLGLTYSLGSNAGVVRITGYSSDTSVSAIVLESLGGTDPVSNWEEGSWSPRRGYVSGVALDEGRLWLGGKDFIYGSVSDGFESYDDTIEGDSGPIIRSLGSGPVDTINWLLPLQRLVIGVETSEKVVRSSSLDEPITPTVFNIRTPSTRGSTAVAPVKIDTSGAFVRNNRLFELEYNGRTFDYEAIDLTSYVPEIGVPGFIKIDVQRYPDTRIHCVKSDGTAAILVFDRNEEVRCWIDFETDGFIEDVVVRPAETDRVEDSVYYTVRRTVNGTVVRHYEKWALESECIGGTQNNQADSFVSGAQSPSPTIAGLDHLEGKDVIVWADGRNYSPRTVGGGQVTFRVSDGTVTLPEPVSSYVVGLPYSARYKSTKLAYAAQGGTALLQSKRIETLGVIMRDTHNRGLRYGMDFDRLYEMPLVEGGADVHADKVWDEYDERPFEFEQEFDTDARLCLEAMAPAPCTLLALVMKVSTNDRV